MAKRSGGGDKTAKPSGAGPKERPGKSAPAEKKPSKKAMVRASNAAGVPLRSGSASKDRSFEVRKISNGHIVRESYSHPTKGYTSRETFVAGQPKITITGSSGKPVRMP